MGAGAGAGAGVCAAGRAGSGRGAGVDFAYGAAGTGLSTGTTWFEYSLDGGAHWAKRDQAWTDAVADKGNVTILPGDLPAAMDGVAPYLRQTTVMPPAAVATAPDNRAVHTPPLADNDADFDAGSPA